VTKPRDLANSVNTGPVAGFRNLIINGLVNTSREINQRGLTHSGVANGAYFADRWKRVDASNMTQIIEAGNYEPSATYTLSGVGVTTQQLTAPASGDWTLPNIASTASKIQLERGTVATSFEERFKGLELALCQRYYEEVWCQWATSWSASMNNHSAKYKVTKRAAPTLTVYADTTAYAKTGTVANVRNTTGSADIAVGSLLTEASVDGFAIDYATGTASAINMRATVVASIEL
jgi:hypothetical protein